MLKKVELLLFLAIVAGLVIFSNRLVENVSSQEIERDEIKIVIDAGHGGNDPGKVGVNDALEKDINLQIAKKVKELLEEKDMKVVMTRVDDVMLGSGESNNKKLQDMKERVSLMKQEKPVEQICQELVDEALRHGGKDNVTVLVLEIQGEGDAVQEDAKAGGWWSRLGKLFHRS